MPLKPSPQQATFYDWIDTGTGNAILIAVAGSGKTTSLVTGVHRMKGSVAFAAYNKKIADEIASKIEDVVTAQAGTFHSFGLRAWKAIAPRAKVDGKKLYGLMDDAETPAYLHEFVHHAVSLAKQQGIGITSRIDDKAAWNELVAHFDLDTELVAKNGYSDSRYSQTVEEGMLDEAIAESIKILNKSIESAYTVIDFDDMIYMPLRAKATVQQFDWVLVDEAQDSNPTRRALAKAMLKPGGRFVAVGDPAQAIYGFTGADSDALDIIKHEFGCIELPLTVTFRCPKAVVAVAQEWVSHITCDESAPQGSAIEISEDQFYRAQAEELTADDAVLCRNTRPLIALAYAYLRRGIPCHVEGKEIGYSLWLLANRWPKIQNLSVLRDKLQDYCNTRTQELMAKGKEGQADSLNDKTEALYAIMDGLPDTATKADLKAQIERLFGDTTPGSKSRNLTLSTIHKSKGREWNRVYWLRPDKFQPSKYARQDWQLNQETNLMYVAVTRAKEQLITVIG